MKIGFIGLGIMGKPMVKNLLKENIEVLVNDINKESIEEVVRYGAKDSTIQTISNEVDYLILSLPNGAIVKSVLYSGENNILNNNKINIKGVIDTSSLTPNESLEISKVLGEREIKYFDAPVSGGEPLAISGELSVMVGCE